MEIEPLVLGGMGGKLGFFKSAGVRAVFPLVPNFNCIINVFFSVALLSILP